MDTKIKNYKVFIEYDSDIAISKKVKWPYINVQFF